MKQQISNFLEALNWRYAAKRMTGKKIDTAVIENIIEAARLAPTSVGMQPFEVLVIEDQALKEKLRPACFNQPQTTECSHLLVFAVWDDVTPEKIDAYLANVAQTREQTLESLAPLKKGVTSLLIGKTTEHNLIWAKNQTYIALGFAMAACAVQKTDCTPMEGFSPAAVDELLELPKLGLKASVLLAIGERDTKTDYLTGKAKVRRPLSQFARWLP